MSTCVLIYYGYINGKGIPNIIVYSHRSRSRKCVFLDAPIFPSLTRPWSRRLGPPDDADVRVYSHLIRSSRPRNTDIFTPKMHRFYRFYSIFVRTERVARSSIGLSNSSIPLGNKVSLAVFCFLFLFSRRLLSGVK